MDRSVRSKISGSDDRRDRISDLVDDLLVHILVLLPLVEAVRTCVLSRRWRHVWTRLPRLEFDDGEDAAGVSSFEEFVARVIHHYATDVVMPDVSISVLRCFQYTFRKAVRIAALTFFLMEQRASTTTKSFRFFMSRYAVNPYDDGDESEDERELMLWSALHMPCFPMVTEFMLTFPGVELWMPTMGTFARLSKLYISGVRFSDEGDGINNVVSQRCPCLQDLELDSVDGLKNFFLRSESVLRLRLFKVRDLKRLIVLAKNLGKMEVTECFLLTVNGTWMLLNLPKLEQLHWEDRCPDDIIYSQNLPSQLSTNLPSHLSTLTLIQPLLAYYPIVSDGPRYHFTRIMQAFERIDILHLEIPIAPGNAEQKNLIENTNIPFFGELDLNVHKKEHMFGPTILNFLKRRSWVRKFSLKITYNKEAGNIIPTCTSDCDCRKIQNWRDNKITLPYLKMFAMKEFYGTQDEKGFLYYIVRNAKTLRNVSIIFSEGVKPPRMFIHTLNKLAPPGCSFKYSHAI